MVPQTSINPFPPTSVKWHLIIAFLTHCWGPGNGSCDLWQAVSFVASAIINL